MVEKVTSGSHVMFLLVDRESDKRQGEQKVQCERETPATLALSCGDEEKHWPWVLSEGRPRTER